MSCDILIVGSGLAGLYCARELLKHNARQKIFICEKYKKLGGRTFTFYKGDISWEMGAGRISNSHIMVYKLLKEYGLHTIPIGEGLKYRETGQSDYEDNHFEPSIDILLGPLRMLPASILGSNTLRELLIGVYGEKETQMWMNRFPYHAEIVLMRADMALREFFEEMHSHSGYSVCKEGLSALVDAMELDIKKRGGIFWTDHELITIRRGHAIFMNKENKVEITAKKIVLAVPVNALRKLSLFKGWKPLSYVCASPLLRIYAQFKQPTAWFHGLPRIVTTSPIRYFIPINENSGTAMISYTDNIFAEHYMKLGDGLQKEVMKDLRELFPERKIPDPDEFQVFQWEDGVSYWIPGKYIPEKISMDALSPFPDIYICGESFSMRQGWMEGALEHTAKLLKILKSYLL
jgi:hypothetical protein